MKILGCPMCQRPSTHTVLKIAGNKSNEGVIARIFHVALCAMKWGFKHPGEALVLMLATSQLALPVEAKGLDDKDEIAVNPLNIIFTKYEGVIDANFGSAPAIVVPRVTTGLTPEQRSLLASCRLSDLQLSSSEDENVWGKLMENILVSVIKGVATQKIMEGVPKMFADAERRVEEVELGAQDDGSWVEVDAIAIEELESLDDEISDTATELANDLTERAILAEEGSEGMRKSAKLPPIGDAVKDELKDGIKKHLQEKVGDHLRQEMRRNTVKAQRAARDKATSGAKLTKREIKEVTKQAKTEYLMKISRQIKAFNKFTGVAVDYSVAVGEGMAVEGKTVSDAGLAGIGEVAQSTAKDMGVERLVTTIGSQLGKISPTIGNAILQHGARFFSVMGWLLNTDTLGERRCGEGEKPGGEEPCWRPN